MTEIVSNEKGIGDFEVNDAEDIDERYVSNEDYVKYSSKSDSKVLSALTIAWSVARAEPTPVGEIVVGIVTVIVVAYLGTKILDDLMDSLTTFDAPVTTVGHYDEVSKGNQGKGERGQAKSASGTDNPFKKLKPDPNKPGNVLEKNSHTGKTVSKPAPPGYPGK